MTDVLAGVSVAEVSVRGSAAYAGKLLSALGADVTRFEARAPESFLRRYSFRSDHPSSTTAAYAYFTAGRGPAVDIEATGLVDVDDRFDICLIDVAPHDFDDWGLDAERLQKLAPIVASITPFGLSGPYSGYRGSELTTMAFGGISSGIGSPKREPLRIPLMQSAQQAGLIAAIVSVGYLGAADSGGSRVLIDVSESDVWATVHAGTSMISFLFANRKRGRGGRRVLGLPFPHGIFRCKDGHISIQSGRRFRYEGFLEMVGKQDWIETRPYGSRLEMQNTHFETIHEELMPWFMQRTRQQVFDECARRDIPSAPVRTLPEVLADEALIGRDAFEDVQAPDGSILRVPASPIRYINE